MWAQLPQFVMQRVLERFSAFSSSTAAMRELLRVAMNIASSSLRAQHDLQQQVSDLQASMAAVLKHLQLPSPTGQQQADQQ